jgi:uncharacterized protein YecT (DUF1311 family)
MSRLLLLSIPLLICATPVIAADRAKPEAVTCNNAQSQMEMNNCASIDHDKSDAKLTATYRKLVDKLDDRAKVMLRDAERAWIVYRDKTCAFETSRTENGSVHGMIRTMCLTGMIEGRIKELDAHFNCEEGDLSCVRRARRN